MMKTTSNYPVYKFIAKQITSYVMTDIDELKQNDPHQRHPAKSNTNNHVFFLECIIVDKFHHNTSAFKDANSSRSSLNTQILLSVGESGVFWTFWVL